MSFNDPRAPVHMESRMLRFAMKSGAARAYSTGAKALFGLMLAGVLAGCAAPRPGTALVYDFGPGAVALAPANRMAPLPPLVLAEVQAPQSLDNTSVLYRLNYSDAHVLQPYAQARWSMPPAQLLRQQLRAALSAQRAVLNANEGVQSPAGALVLRLELEEFSQIFDSPQASSGLLRLRATLSQSAPGGEALVAQRVVLVKSPAASPDAAGGVRALAAAAVQAVEQLDQWVQQTQAALPAKL
jgi:cholesterol transport system auxiliary component